MEAAYDKLLIDSLEAFLEEKELKSVGDFYVIRREAMRRLRDKLKKLQERVEELEAANAAFLLTDGELPQKRLKLLM